MSSVMPLILTQVHEQGWSEGSKGQGSSRSVTDAEFEDMTKILRDAGWEFILTDKETKKVEDKGELPKKVSDKVNIVLIASRVPMANYLHHCVFTCTHVA